MEHKIDTNSPEIFIIVSCQCYWAQFVMYKTLVSDAFHGYDQLLNTENKDTKRIFTYPYGMNMQYLYALFILTLCCMKES